MQLDADQFKDIDIECEIFQRPERILAWGGSYSGKSHMIYNLILRHHKKFKKIILCGAKSPLLTHPETRSKTIFYEDDERPIYDPWASPDDLPSDSRQTLLILDDMMEYAFSSPIVSRLFSRGRHINYSVIVVFQSYHPQGSSKSLVPMLKNNSSIQIFFKLRNRGEMRLISRKVEHHKSGQNFFDTIVEREIYQKRFGYLVLYNDDPIAKYRNNLIYEDNLPYETVFMK